MEVNKLTKLKALAYVKEQFRVWSERSKKTYKLDVKVLKRFGIDLKK